MRVHKALFHLFKFKDSEGYCSTCHISWRPRKTCVTCVTYLIAAVEQFKPAILDDKEPTVLEGLPFPSSSENQGRIHGNPVADGWAGAVMQPVAHGQYVVSDTRCPAMYVGNCR